MFYNKEERVEGGILITFSNAVLYNLLFCHGTDMRPLPSELPAEIDKHWVIEKNGYRIRIRCNGVLVLDQTASGGTCDPDYYESYDQSEYWGQKVSGIKFRTTNFLDTASDYYYIESG